MVAGCEPAPPELPSGRWVPVEIGAARQWDEGYPPPCRLEEALVCYAQYYTGGAAARDLDGDGRLDLYLARMEGPDQILFNTPEGFIEGSVPGLGGVEHSNGVAFSDIDNDGDDDLLISTTGGDRFHLFINDGSGAYTEEAEARGAAQLEPHLHSSMSVCFGDYDLDGFPDLSTNEWRLSGLDPAFHHNRLLHNLGASAPGHFEDLTGALGVDIYREDVYGVWGFTSHLTDLDGDGRPELAVAADYLTSRLFWGEDRGGSAAFVDGTAEAGVGTDENGMGSALGDYDGDGDLDWFVSAVYDPRCRREECSWGGSGNRLYRNDGGRRFTDVTAEAGLSDSDWAWGAAFLDYDLDGDLDLVVVNGVRLVLASAGLRDTPVRLYENVGGRFTDHAEALGLIDREASRAVLPFDYDGDGDEDLLITHTGPEPLLFRNEIGDGRSWLVVRPVGRGSGGSSREGLGAVVRVWAEEDSAPMLRVAGNGCGFLAHTEGLPRFGLGDLERVARVRVEWPASGQVQELTDVPTRQILVVEEPE